MIVKTRKAFLVAGLVGSNLARSEPPAALLELECQAQRVRTELVSELVADLNVARLRRELGRSAMARPPSREHHEAEPLRVARSEQEAQQ